MTNQDVINFLNQVREILLDDKSWLESTTQPINEAFDMAISALEKQIPKELIAEGDGCADGEMVYDSFYCPSCDHHMEDYEVKDYCPECGQKICWE